MMHASFRLVGLLIVLATTSSAGLNGASATELTSDEKSIDTGGVRAGGTVNALTSAPESFAAVTAQKSNPTMFRSVAAVCLLLALLGCHHLYRRHQKQTDPSGDIIVLSNKQLSSKHRVVLLDVEGQHLLVSLSDHGVSLIANVPGTHRAMPFGDLLEQRTKQLDVAPLPGPASLATQARASEEIEGIVRLREQRRRNKEGSRR